MSNVVHRVTVSVGERGERLTRAEDQTLELMHKAQQFADTAHKVRTPRPNRGMDPPGQRQRPLGLDGGGGLTCWSHGGCLEPQIYISIDIYIDISIDIFIYLYIQYIYI